jgi:hypothetical protein
MAKKLTNSATISCFELKQYIKKSKNTSQFGRVPNDVLSFLYCVYEDMELQLPCRELQNAGRDVVVQYKILGSFPSFQTVPRGHELYVVGLEVRPCKVLYRGQYMLSVECTQRYIPWKFLPSMDKGS